MFEKGHKLAPGGRREGAGRPSNAALAAMAKARAYVERRIEADMAKVYKRYRQFAEDDPTTARHFIDKAVPAAKQEIELSGQLKVVKVDSFDPEDK